MTSETQRIEIGAIVFDAGTQVREAIHEATVADYADQMGQGHVFPPVVLFHDGSRYYMADGFHRGLAARRLGLAEIDAVVHAGTRADALWFAIKAFGEARRQGLRPTTSDTKHAIFLVFDEWPDMSTTRIAEQIGCNQSYVSHLKPEYELSRSTKLPDRTTGKDGKSRPARRGGIPKDEQKRATVRELVEQGKLSQEIRRETRISDAVIAEVRRDMGLAPIDKSREAVAMRIERMRILAADGYTSRQISAAVGLADETCRQILRREQIDVPADRAVGKTKRHDSNRIIDRIVMDAENLTAGVELIDFDAIDRRQLRKWIDGLVTSRRALDAFIRRLTKEHNRGEAAEPEAVQDSSRAHRADARPSRTGLPA